MYAAKVIGTVVCTQKDEKLNGRKLQVVQPVSLLTLQYEGKPAVAIDSVGAGMNEMRYWKRLKIKSRGGS
ncbi:MAG TPA: EutN/CcmL family microcompartment protein [Negativicutes bacterium]|nr:EutN/CcmL family microcompartment protein [Negativicutes bacterium]